MSWEGEVQKKYIAGAAETVVKNSAGKLKGIMVTCNTTAGEVSIYDAASGFDAGNRVYRIGIQAANTIAQTVVSKYFPLSADMDNGITVKTTGGISYVTVEYW